MKVKSIKILNINLAPFPPLTTDRLLLRKLTVDDRHELLQLRSDAIVNTYLGRPNDITIDDIDAYINKIVSLYLKNGCAYWAISLKDDPRLIGAICLWNFVPEEDKAEIGYELRPAYHGQGYMQEAITKVIDYGFNSMRLKVITALPNPENKKSVTLLERNHFQLDLDYKYVDREGAGEQAVYFLINK